MPGTDPTSGGSAATTISQANMSSEVSEIEISIRYKDVVVTTQFIGSSTYSEKCCTKDEINRVFNKKINNNDYIVLIDDYADYETYGFVLETLKVIGVSEDRIVEKTGSIAE